MPLHPLVLRHLDAEKTGMEIPLNSHEVMADVVLAEAEFTHDQIRNSIVASDMDNTMFADVPDRHIIGDLGILVFIEKMADPSFWKFRTGRFRALLLPEKYRKCAIDHLPGGTGNLGINPDVCRRILDMADDIVELYSIQKELVAIAEEERKNGNGIQVDITTPIVNEFALKMIEFDELIKQIENPMIDHGQGRILMRTRFFAGKNIENAREMTRNIMARSVNANASPNANRNENAPGQNGHITLRMHDGIQDDVRHLGNGHRYAQRTADIDPKNFQRIVAMHQDVRRLIARLTAELEAYGVVISANLKAIAEEAVAGSTYARLIEKIIASKLKIAPGDIYLPQFEGEAIHGEAKVKALQSLQQVTGKLVRVAMGDSFRGDGPMGIEAIRNGGIFVVTGDSFENIQRQFSQFPKRAKVKGVTNAEKRTWALSY